MAPELQVKWFRSHAWLVALIGLVLEAAATIPFALLDVSAPETSAALAMLIGAAVAFVVGPRWGALVSAAGWGLFFAFVADQEARAILALPVWLAVAILAGLASDRLRRVERERQRDAGELDAVRHEAESRYHALAEALPLVTLISAPNDRNSVSYVSPQVETLLGYSPAEWQEDPELYSKLLHPDDRDEVLAGAKQQSTGAAPRKAEYRLLARGGGVVWVREEVTTIRGPKGKPLYTQTLLIDIGERKRAEEERERLLAAEREATARTVERQRRLDFVREAGQVLSSSLDYRSAIQRVAELAVREYADWCVVDIIEDGSPLKRVAIARAELLSQEAAVAPDQEPEEAVRTVVETGGLKIVPALGEAPKGRKKTSILGGIDARSAICVPLPARKRTLGALTLARTELRRDLRCGRSRPRRGSRRSSSRSQSIAAGSIARSRSGQTRHGSWPTSPTGCFSSIVVASCAFGTRRPRRSPRLRLQTSSATLRWR